MEGLIFGILQYQPILSTRFTILGGTQFFWIISLS